MAGLEGLRASLARLGAGDPDQVALELVRLVTDTWDANWAGVFLAEEASRMLRGAWGCRQHEHAVPLRQVVLPLDALQGGPLSPAAYLALFGSDHLAHGSRTPRSRGVTAESRHAVVVPMRGVSRAIGVLVADHQPSGLPLSPESVEALTILAGQAAILLENSRLRLELRRALAAEPSAQATEESASRLPSGTGEEDCFSGIVAQSPGMRQAVELSRLATRTDDTVLILGESGTGKDLLAHAIHAHSRRQGAPLVVANSASLSAGLEDSELFGHVKGAFTGATRDSDGLVVTAHGGTLFLDEIGDLSSSSQAKLLRTLEKGEVRRVGDNRTHKVDIRFIAATNRDLGRAAAEGAFRADLYYRLAVITIRVPPLRERPEDVPWLVCGFLGRAAAQLGLPRLEIRPAALELLVAAPWPGNARQLDSCVRQAALLSGAGPIDECHLPVDIRCPKVSSSVARPQSLAELEKQHILQVMDHCRHDRRRAQQVLGISRATLQRRLRGYGLTD